MITLLCINKTRRSPLTSSPTRQVLYQSMINTQAIHVNNAYFERKQIIKSNFLKVFSIDSIFPEIFTKKLQCFKESSTFQHISAY